ncbi:MAG: hypothetical protein ASARMPRED_006430 [Alectoria sarmentosa]|nr:MAG: hypothetical protein ASARMPRED_006430 [Alectoria sarmentosa]
MKTTSLARIITRVNPLICLHPRPFSTSPSDPPPPPPQRPQHPPLPSNIARNANRDAGIALAKSLTQDVDRTNYNTVRKYDAQRALLNDTTKTNRVKDLERQMPRLSKWQVGDVYAPHDLSAVEASKWRKRKSSQRDVFDILGINPLEEYKVCGSSILRNWSMVDVEEKNGGSQC